MRKSLGIFRVLRATPYADCGLALMYKGWGIDGMGEMRTHAVLWETVGGDTNYFLWLGYLTSTLPFRSDFRGLRAGRQPEGTNPEEGQDKRKGGLPR